jgi:hypothetical protein
MEKEFLEQEKETLYKKLLFFEEFIKTDASKEEIISDFKIWLDDIKKVDPLKIEKNKRQLFVDDYLNSDHGRLYLMLLPLNCYDHWPEFFKCDFIALIQKPLYHPKDTNWSIEFNKQSSLYEVTYNLGDLKQFYYKKIKLYKFIYKNDLSVSDLFDRFTSWLENVKKINPTELKIDEIQEFVDQLFNSEEGRMNMALLDVGHYSYWPDSTKCDLLSLIKEECLKINPQWKIKSIIENSHEVYRVVPKKLNIK